MSRRTLVGRSLLLSIGFGLLLVAGCDKDRKAAGPGATTQPAPLPQASGSAGGGDSSLTPGWRPAGAGDVSADAPTTRPEGAATYYVSPTGKNDNDGSRATPWATPGYGSRQLHPGDMLVILPGKYVCKEYDDDVVVPPSGTEKAWVTICGPPGGPKPVLAGRDNLLSLVELRGVSYVRLENLELTHDDTAKGEAVQSRDGIEILEKESSHIVLKDLYFHHLDEFGINAQDVVDMKVDSCRAEYCGFGGIGGPAGQKGGWRKVLVRNCLFAYSGHYYRGGDGSGRPYERPDGLGTEVADGPLEIAYTRSEHNCGDGLDSKVRNTYVHHCVVANNSCDGLKLWGTGSKADNTLVYGTGDGQAGDSNWACLVIDEIPQPGGTFEITNCTFGDNPGHKNYMGYSQYGDARAPVTIIMRNCIFANGSAELYFGDSVKLTAENNIFFCPGHEVQVHANQREYSAADLKDLGKANISKDPKFVKPAWGKPGDYHLADGSPAIGAGTHVGATGTDLEDKPRSKDKPVDLGAYQR